MSVHFTSLSEEERRALGQLGVEDVDASCDALIAECRVMPPPRLLRDLALAPVLAEEQIDRCLGHWKRAA